MNNKHIFNGKNNDIDSIMSLKKYMILENGIIFRKYIALIFRDAF